MFIKEVREKNTEKRGGQVLRIVALGSGYTVLGAAGAIKRGAPHCHVTVINRERRHATLPHAPELLSGQKHLDEISVDLEQHYRRHNVEFIHGDVTRIDRAQKRIYIGDIELPYDLLLLDLGSEPEIQAVPGGKRSHTNLTPTGMLELRAHIVTQFLKLRATNDPKHRTFIVAGAGIAGVEIACALKQLMHDLCEQHLIFPHEIAVVLVEHEATDYPLRTGVKKKLRRILEDKDIEYYDGMVTQYSEGGVTLGDVTLESETLVWCGQKHASHLLKGVGVELDAYGAAVVNKFFQTEDPSIFAAGDCASLPAAKAHTIPRTAFMSFDEEQAFANCIVAAVHNKPLHAYHPRAPLPVFITTGPNTALLVTSLYSWHGKIPYALKRWALSHYARRVKNR